MMTGILLLCSMWAGSETLPPPSPTEISQAVVANRERIRTAHVRTYSRRILKKQEISKELYLDADANRWRIDTTGMGPMGEPSAPTRKDAFVRKTGVSDGMVYQYHPLQQEVVARKDSLENGVKTRHVMPFPDPRNAGLVPTYIGNTGTPFEFSGSRLCIYPAHVDCAQADQVSVEPAVWKGVRCWRVAFARHNDLKQRLVRHYTVVPQWGHSVVSLMVETYLDQQETPCFAFSVESEVALHEKSQLWFPTQVVYRGDSEGKRIEEEITDVEVVSLNEAFPESTFTFKGLGVPAGHTVIDITDPGDSKTVWDGERVIRLQGASPLGDSGTTRGLHGVRRWTVIGSSVLCVCLSAILWWRGHQRNRLAGP
jgi:hypothetical protein